MTRSWEWGSRREGEFACGSIGRTKVGVERSRGESG